MDFQFPAATTALRLELRRWLTEHLTGDILAASQAGLTDPAAFAVLRRWSRTLADAGWAAISWPWEYGGRDASLLDQLVYGEETARARAPLPVNIIGLNNIAPAIMQYGTEEQRQTLLPRMMRADDIWCQGMSEPDAGSDLASLRTRAVHDGSFFVVSGQKTWISLGHQADWCQLFVRTDPDARHREGISCLIVDMASPGIQARPLVTLTGETHFAEVFFDAVRVPVSALLGPLHQGWNVATTTLSHERANAARLYAETRVQLSDLVADLAAIRDSEQEARADQAGLDRLGEMDVRLAFLEILCKRAVSGALHGQDTSGTAGLAKTVWGQLGQDLSALAFDLLGPDATDGRWARQRLAARALTIAGGTTQVTKNITATRVLGLPRR